MTPSQFIAVVNLVALITIMLSMGLQVSLDSVLKSVRQLHLLAWCVIANYVLVPLVALGLLIAFQANPMVSVGFLILAVCPAAPVGPPLTAIAKGHVSLSIGMMLVLAALSALLSPALLSLLITFIPLESELSVDYFVIVRTLLVAQLLPLAVGLLIHSRWPRLTERIQRPVGLFANIMMLVLIVAIIIAQLETLSAIRWRSWAGMSALLGGSLIIGWLAGGRELADRKAMAMTTGPRNAAVGLAIATGNYANTPVVTAVVAYGLASMLGTMVFGFWIRRCSNPIAVD